MLSSILNYGIRQPGYDQTYIAYPAELRGHRLVP